ncbi:XAC2610-related protein [Hymenobacter monticola]|uniref:VCBS repeat-containing protein n=1 Tax=Hymenobacter monticola TaxID=1705399 RepID=A0ABY4B6U0_9BACT|nr:hypothetical protein [Hymenobacter monticola]UOE33731.1 hypothetical protein MTP16_21735 [Hymenobacter monticola]
MSKTHTFKITSQRFKRADSIRDSCMVTISVFDKQNQKLLQNISYPSTHFFSNVYRRCNAVRSYSTGTNKNTPATDNDYGDFIVADFNFDGKDDFAAKNDSGGNGGPTYNYYIQNRTGKFVIDHFLTQYVAHFPYKISKQQKTLATLVHANADQLKGAAYQFDSAKNEWRRILHWWQ